MNRPSVRLAGIMEWLAIAILLEVASIVYAQNRGDMVVKSGATHDLSGLIDYAQNSLDCVGHGNDGIGLMVKRRSDGKVVSLNFCAAAEDAHYATVKAEQRAPAKK